MPLLWLGLGSNFALVRDGGVRVVIATGALPREPERLDGGRARGRWPAARAAGCQCVRWQLVRRVLRGDSEA